MNYLTVDFNAHAGGGEGRGGWESADFRGGAY